MPALRELWFTVLLWFHRLTRHPSQSTVCGYCATGSLSPRSWNAMMRDKSAIVFPTTRARLLAGQNEGCNLCRLLVDLGVGEGPEAEVIFQVDRDPDNPVDEPVDTQYLLVHARITGCLDKFRTYCMYTPTGAFCHSLARSQIWQCTRASKIHGSAVHCRRPGGRRDCLQGPYAPC